MVDEQAVVKAAKLARAAKANGWHGTFNSEEIEGERLTTLEVTRNDEYVVVCYTGNSMVRGEYKLFERTWNLHCASVALERLESWPDLIKMFKWFPNKNKPSLVESYRRLPFSFEEENSAIMAKLMGHSLFWYSHEFRRLQTDVVIVPKKATTKNYRIVDVGHRKLFHFIGAQAGFRSVLLDTLIKVG